jgi:hypothetical protein
MKLFIAIVFFCQGQDCAFWKGDKISYTQEECRAYLAQSLDHFPKFPILVGTCIPVSTNNLVSQ